MGGGKGEALGTSAGIALSGSYIYNALAAGNMDAVEGEGMTLDVCLSHPSPFGEFHYHFWSSCIKKNQGYWSDSKAPPLCKENIDCMKKTADFTRAAAQSPQTPAYTAAKWDDVIGIARDGHMIIGPYKPDGTTWGCERDVCNGAFVDGSYVYVGSDNFPYVVGCWGPGPDPLYKPSCTNSGCGSLAGSATSNDQAALGAAVGFASFAAASAIMF